ncbi:hypothetical protein BMS3Bbin06_01573 [bacterium BMS3Bbin06]|nr:hypothetical protein BMS3Abin08_00731 [bacterium BMS3Abin08]GBE35039.1 hypothetical protein BMS3Bbin06_01573 [bacterium BMS3Bbin06]
MFHLNCPLSFQMNSFYRNIQILDSKGFRELLLIIMILTGVYVLFLLTPSLRLSHSTTTPVSKDDRPTGENPAMMHKIPLNLPLLHIFGWFFMQLPRYRQVIRRMAYVRTL